MFQGYKYSFLTLIRNKSQLFWTLIFPILIGTLFNFIYSSMDVAFTEIPVAIVDSESDYLMASQFKEVIEELAAGDEALLIPHYVTLETAQEMLLLGEIIGFFQIGDQVLLTIADEGMKQSILKMLLEQFIQMNSTLKSISSEESERLGQVMEELNKELSINQELFIGKSGEENLLSYYFYLFLAMTCFMGSHYGFDKAMTLQADTSPVATRRSISATKKWILVTSEFLAVVTVQFLLTLGGMMYYILVLNADFGEQTLFVILTIFVGCLTGVSFGSFLATALKGDIKLRESLVTGFSFLFYLLAGLFNLEVKIAIRQYAPFLDWFNPMALISDAFQALIFYDNYDRYFQLLGMLLVLTTIFCVTSAVALRRKLYDYI